MQTRQKQGCSIPQNSSIHLHLFRSAKPTFPSPTQVRNLCSYLDKDLSMKEHISFIWKTAFPEIWRFSTICHYLTDDATQTLVVSLLLARIDYCSSLLAGLPQCWVGKLQKAHNSAACLVVRALPHVHITPILRHLHWLPVRARISYKTAMTTK